MSPSDSGGPHAHGDRAFDREPALHLRFGARRAAGARATPCGWSCIRSSMCAATRRARCRSSPGPKAELAEGWQRESFVHVHVPLIRDAAQEAALTKGLTSLLDEVRLATDDWSRHARRGCAPRSPISASITRRSPRQSSRRRSSSCNGWTRGISSSSACANIPMTERSTTPVEQTSASARARAASRSDGDGASPRHGSGDADAGDPRLPDRARSAHRDQGERPHAHPPPRLHGLCRREDIRRRARSRASCGSSASSPPAPSPSRPSASR